MLTVCLTTNSYIKFSLISLCLMLSCYACAMHKKWNSKGTQKTKSKDDVHKIFGWFLMTRVIFDIDV